MSFATLTIIFTSLLGFPAFVAATINVLKYFEVLPDGWAPKAVLIANLLIFAVAAVLYFTDNLPLLVQLDQQMGLLASLLLKILAFITELGLAKVFHLMLKGTPVIGTSNSSL